MRIELVDSVGTVTTSLTSIGVSCEASALDRFEDGDIAEVEGSLRLANGFAWLFDAQRIVKCAGKGRLTPEAQRERLILDPDLCSQAAERLESGQRAPRRLPVSLPAAGRLRVRWVGPHSPHARRDVQGHLPGVVQSDWRQVSFYDPSAIAEAIADRSTECDLIVVYRGGGGWRDWLPLNDVRVVNAVGESSIPVVTAIGHETTAVALSWVSAGDFGTPTEVRKAIGSLGFRTAPPFVRPAVDLKQRDLYRKEIDGLRSELSTSSLALRRLISEKLALETTARSAVRRQIELAQTLALERIHIRGFSRGILTLLPKAAAVAAAAFGNLPFLPGVPWWVAGSAIACALVIGILVAAFFFRARGRALTRRKRASPSSHPAGSTPWLQLMSAVRSPRAYRRLRRD